MTVIKVFEQSKLIASLQLVEGQEYIVGRDPSTQLVLPSATFSRKHLRIFYEMNWQIELLSKYDTIEHNGSPVTTVELSTNTSFQVQNYRFVFEMSVDEVKEEPFDEEQSPEKSDVPVELVKMDLDEDTNIGEQVLSPYVIVSNTEAGNAKQALSGEEWSLGRSEKCDIVITDSKASRKHCIITKDHAKYFVSDLGSSNGTELNGIKMKANKIAPLQSGDIIKIGRQEITFELINNALAEEIKNYPAQAILPPKKPQMLVAPPTNTNIPSTGKGAVRITNTAKPKLNLKFLAIAGAILVVMAIVLSGGKKNTEQNRDLASKEDQKTEFERLKEQDQRLVLRFYDNANRYYINGEFKKAMNEISRIHRLLPNEGYLDLSVDKDSRRLEKYVRAALEIERKTKEVNASIKAQKQLEKEIAEMVATCDKQAIAGTSVAQAQACLSNVYELDPDNFRAKQIIQRLESEEQQRQAKQQSRAYYRAQVNKGESLYNRARGKEKRGQILDAIGAYQRHIASTYPDPANLKKKSAIKKKTLSIELKKQIESLLKQAESEYESKNFKVSILKLNRVLQLDPSVREAKTLLSKVTNELNKNMKSLYSDSVLEESMGNIETSKSLWKKILETDVPSGDYYRKARSKMKKYGG